MTDHELVAQDLPERDAEIYRLRVVDRLTFREIGERYGVSAQAVNQTYLRVAAARPPIDIEAIRQEALEQLVTIQREALAMARMNGAPVTAGKDGDVVYDPEDGGVVRDFAGRMNALKLAGWAGTEIRKLTGADAATKVESTATIRYELAGIDPETLK